MVKWKPITDFPGYEVSSDGQVRRGARIKATEPDRKGYLRVKLWRDGKAFNRFVARLVAAAFIGPRPAGQVVRHRDGKNDHNAASNLRYGTPVENEADKREHGTYLVGDAHPATKLSDAQIVAIRARYKPYSRTDGGRALSKEYGVWPETIWSIASLKKRTKS